MLPKEREAVRLGARTFLTGELLGLAARLAEERQPFALATVVGSRKPSSGRPGDSALISADGTMRGWIGGSCTRSEVIRHAREALRAGAPRLLAFGALDARNRTDGDAAGAAAERSVIHAPMACASEGQVEVHINPVLPSPVLVVSGDSPVASALLALGRAMGYRTVAAGGGDQDPSAADEWEPGPREAAKRYGERPDGTRLFVVVASMGQGDEHALAALAGALPDYLGVVASPRRMHSVRAALLRLGLGEDVVGRIRGPAGLDIGARRPPEIALSILAEIVERGAAREGSALDGARPAQTVPAAADPPTATDPVCGMSVPVAGSPATVYRGHTVHFCCEGCRGLFEATPEIFAANAHGKKDEGR